MNARQKAKKYKSELLRLRDELDTRKASKLITFTQPRIETVKLVQLYDYKEVFLSQGDILKDIGRRVGKFLVDNDMVEIYFHDEKIDHCVRAEAYVKVVKEKG
jgi:hypothetical protein